MSRAKSPSTATSSRGSKVTNAVSTAPTSKHQGPQQDTELLIRGVLYDVAGFKHPGGSIVKFYAGKGDATEAFDAFHTRSVKAQKMLKARPQREAPAPLTAPSAREKRYAAMTKDFSALCAELRSEGWFDPDLIHVAYRCLEIIAMHLVGIYLLLTTPYWPIALLILGVAQGRCGWLMHEGGHLSMTGNIKVDIRLHEMIYGVGCGMSGGWWRVQHNKHHATPQKLGHDADLETLPLVAWNEKCVKLAKTSSALRTWLKFQKYTFAPVTCFLVAMGWQFFLHPRYIFRVRKYAEAFWFVVRYFLVYQVAQAYGADLKTAILGYCLYVLAGGCYIFTNFALSHTHLPVVEADDHQVHWMEYAADYTININPIAPVNWWMGYLNFQIEHHLFPSMPQYKFVKLSPRIQTLFKKHGLKYDVRNYFSAMGDTWANLSAVASGV